MLIFLPFHLHEKQAFKWVFGSFLCQLTRSVVFFNIAVVILTLVAMAFDRYCTVVPNIMTKTVNKHRNKRWFIFSMIGLTWILAIISAYPVFTRAESGSITSNMSHLNDN